MAAANQRGRYNRISNADRNRIIDAFENDGDYLQVADTLGIKRQTARSIILTFYRHNRRNALRRGGARPPKVDQEMINVLDAIVNENCLLTYCNKLMMNFVVGVLKNRVYLKTLWQDPWMVWLLPWSSSKMFQWEEINQECWTCV